MNNIGKYKRDWLDKNGCIFKDVKDKYIKDDYSEAIKTEVWTVDGEYVTLADLPNKYQYTVNFIYKHRLTKLMSLARAKGLQLEKGSCNPVTIGFSEKEKAWYGWTHRGYGKFYIGYEIKKDSIMDSINPNYPRIKYPFKCETLEDCKECAMKIVEELN